MRQITALIRMGLDVPESTLWTAGCTAQGDPFAYVKQLDIYKELRDAVESDYYEKLVQKYLLDNTHVAVVVVAPEGKLLQNWRQRRQRNWQILRQVSVKNR